MRKLIKFCNKHPLLIALFLFIIVPITVYILSVTPCFPVGGNNDWAGFWGGYLGALLGGVITLCVMITTIEENKKEKIRDEKLSFYDKLLDKITCIDSYQKKVIVASKYSNGSEKEIYENAVIEYNCLLLQIEMMISVEKKKGYHKGIDKISESLKQFLSKSDKLIDKIKSPGNNSSSFQKNSLFNALSIKKLNSDIQNFIATNTQNC